MWWNLAGQRLGVLAGPGASVTPPGHLWVAALQIAPWAIIDAKLAVDAAARQAARHFVEADVQAADDFGEAEADARLAGYEALARGADRARSTVKLTGRESPDGQAGFTRCARATFTASYMYRCCAYRGSAVSAPDST